MDKVKLCHIVILVGVVLSIIIMLKSALAGNGSMTFISTTSLILFIVIGLIISGKLKRRVEDEKIKERLS